MGSLAVSGDRSASLVSGSQERAGSCVVCGSLECLGRRVAAYTELEMISDSCWPQIYRDPRGSPFEVVILFNV